MCAASTVLSTALARRQPPEAVKKIKGRNHHNLTATDGNLVYAVIHTADTQDRDGAPLVLAEIVHRFLWLRDLFADSGCAGDSLKDTLRRFGKWTIAIIEGPMPRKG